MTTADLSTTTGFDIAFADKARALAEGAPEGAMGLARRRAAAAHLKRLSFPARDHELWRRTDFKSLEEALPGLDPFSRPAGARGIADLPAGVRERMANPEAAALVVQRDAGVVFERNHPDLVKQGVIVCSMERAFQEHAALLESKLGSLMEDDYDWYVAFAGALRSGGVFVHVPDGVEAKRPIRVFHWIDGAGKFAAPRSLVLLGRGAQATVIEDHLSDDLDGISFHNGATEVFVGDGAKLVFASLQDWGRGMFHYSNQRARVGRDAELQWIQTILGGRMSKSNAYFDLAGPGARAFVHGFMFGDQRQHFHLHTLQRHQVDHTTSDLLIKGCLKDRARSIYQGLIQVSEGAQQTDAYQANRNLLLSNQARADSIPGLEILANDVRCTHGATIGHVDDEQLYYLMSRGLHPNTAQRLIVEGFFAPVLDRIPLEEVRDQLQQVIQRKIG